jgi:3-deoxy-D-manno-octulosonate 8-phosphate phosphatase (KDO 8-P phosphatase)
MNTHDLALDLASIELIIFDVDGVLTDGSINIHDDGSETKRFNVRDGYGFSQALRSDLKIGIITGRVGQALKHRLDSLKVDEQLVIQGSRDKSESLDKRIAHTGIDASNIAYVGDDCPDLAAMTRVGFSMCPADAEQAVIDACDHVLTRAGGRGAAREAIDLILNARSST